ncbi:aldehyde dehydrogenase [Flavilitoribacter nigricans DSM 23189 = NBRC 102662]|uniref:Aldehyde dehydrogenase n=1 Tax=Flavilitoribacter nigricans (strain ATCC 23147 / DSM 23189 / NBRC 102662 / NCIMB 1420 / SS-2) TaxID=1122177 RepID=A0A2D0N3Z8_FLAN2|nr:aldehyde dehydrogenase [Flavilitoribacter nigricans DSM 23189 = NBRC 102662]
MARREFLLKSGYLSIGFSLLGCTQGSNAATPTPLGEAADFSLDPQMAPLPDGSRIDAWLQVLENGQVRVLTGKMELGQGLKVVMQQVAGEELNIPPQRIDVLIADTGRTQNEGVTAGSRSVERSAMTVRRAAAAAREYMKQLAAKKWETDADALELTPEGVKNNSGTILSFTDLLAGQQLDTEIPQDVSLKPKDQYQWVGSPVPHPDLEKIVRGDAVYIQDMRLPEMVHARLVRPPVYDARLQSRDQAIERMPGVLQIVENGSFLAVIAEEEYQAVKAADALQKSAQWESGTALPEVRSWADYMLEQGEKANHPAPASGNAHHAIYSKPYVMHGSIGPSCAIAVYDEERLHIWSHSQGVYNLRATVSDMTGIPEESIRVTGVRGSGCYGHNGADDVGGDAALIAVAFPGRPVRLQWQRSDEHQWEPYGSAMRMELSASLDNSGRINSWRYDLWSDGHSTRPRGNAGNLIGARLLAEPAVFGGSGRVGGGTRNSEPYYRIPKVDVSDHHVAGPLRTSALRSLGAYANIFAIESFMDELAKKAGKDPLDFRIEHSDDERSVAVLEALRDLIKSEPAAAGEGLGIAFSRYKNSASYCAVAAKVRVDLEQKKIRPLKMWAVLEAGEAINTDGLKNQTEGGMIQSASWTLKEEVKFDTQEILSKNWTEYPIIRYDAIPETEVVIIDRPDLPPLGAGESAQGPAGAAIANAVYAACGKRVRELPIERYLFGS